MTDTTVKKVSAAYSPTGDMGQKYLASGKRVSMRLWAAEPVGGAKAPSVRDYETVGYVITGRAELHLEGQIVMLEARRFLAGAAWRRAQLCDPRAFHRDRGDRAASAGA
jgi:hypothetical protein